MKSLPTSIVVMAETRKTSAQCAKRWQKWLIRVYQLHSLQHLCNYWLQPAYTGNAEAMSGKSIIVVGLLAIGAAALSGGSARADLITNGSFSTGDFNGWTVTGDDISIDQTFANAPADQYDAAFSAAVGDTGLTADTLSQSVSTTPGQSYQVTFSILDENGFAGNLDTFTATFGGFTATVSGQDAAPFADGSDLYTSESLTVPGSAITDLATTLSFEGQNAASPAAWNLDDVSLVALNAVNAVPEPGSLLLLGTALVFSLGLRLSGFSRS